MISKTLSRHTVNCNNILRYAIIFDDKMPSAYVDKGLHIDNTIKNKKYSIEHIFPRSLLNKRDHNDMHNTIRTINDLNVNRSNYRYVDVVTDDKNWIKLNYDNYVNHKLKLFIPNSLTKGFISRAILYMSKEYEYNPHKIIDKDVLIKWFYNHPPDVCEKYHNNIIHKLQNTNNVFISQYGKKSKTLVKYLDQL
jgi:endonuclease I